MTIGPSGRARRFAPCRRATRSRERFHGDHHREVRLADQDRRPQRAQVGSHRRRDGGGRPSDGRGGDADREHQQLPQEVGGSRRGAPRGRREGRGRRSLGPNPLGMGAERRGHRQGRPTRPDVGRAGARRTHHDDRGGRERHPRGQRRKLGAAIRRRTGRAAGDRREVRDQPHHGQHQVGLCRHDSQAHRGGARAADRPRGPADQPGGQRRSRDPLGLRAVVDGEERPRACGVLLAERAAYYSPGVKRVVDNTTVDPYL